MPTWYMFLLGASLIFLAVSTISFRSYTVKRMNREIASFGEFYLSTGDTVGYTLIDMALVVILPIRWAKKVIPKIVVNTDSVSKIALRRIDKILSYCFLMSAVSFIGIGLYGVKFT